MASPGMPARMGFDPRRGRTPHRGRPITANVDALLAENEALRQEVRALRQQLEQLRGRGSSGVGASPGPGITAERVDRWCQAMARHPAWAALRLGPSGGLRGLVEELRRHWWNPCLTLEEELDRQIPGLGSELSAALRGPHSRGRWAVRAAFALYGPRAVEWLNEEPLRVVEELGQRVERLDRRQGRKQGPRQPQAQQHDQTQQHWQRQGQNQEQERRHWQRDQGQAEGRRRGTRTANHSQAHSHASSQASGQTGGSEAPPPGAGPRAAEEPAASPPLDPRRLEALRLLGLDSGASPQAIKRAYWRLAKAHHPDLGGEPEAFHRLDAAYRLLVG
ncbi:MAG: DnaJ domain-containing protein [Cyanobacteriota bacterium]|jgi:hypothetical protein